MENYEETFKSICRLCLNFANKQNMVTLIDNNVNDTSCYGQAVRKFANITIQKKDNLPQAMCVKCLYLLKQAIRFKFMCESSDRCLRNFVNILGNNIGSLKESIVEYAMLRFYFPKRELSTIKSKHRKQNSINSIGNKESASENQDNKLAPVEYFDKLSDTEQNEQSNKDLIDKMESATDQNICNNTFKAFETNNDDFSQEFDNKSDDEHGYRSDNDLLNIMERLVDKNNPFNTTQSLSKQHLKLKNKTHKITIKNKSESIDSIKNQSNDNPKNDDLFNIMEKLIDNNTFSSIEITKPFKRKHLKLKRKLVKRQRMLAIKNAIEKRKKMNLICSICNKLLANRHTYENHMQRHNGCRYICEHCGKGFPVQSELKVHQVSRHGTGPYLQCSHCPFKAPRRFDLIEHERLHSGERPYTCEKCGLTFRRRGIWKKHLIYHTEKKVECPQCPRKFYRRSEMLAHANNIHDRVYVYLCNRCGATYAKTATVRRHMTERHGIPREMQGKVIRINKGIGYQEQ